MGGGSSGPLKLGGISGQGGGRILPGVAGGVGELLLGDPRGAATTTVAPTQPDYRPSPPYGSTFDTVFAAPGGGPGQPGKGDAFVIYTSVDPNNGTTMQVRPIAGGGGGWGAAGGSGTQYLPDFTTQRGGNPGAAGGKAIKTNGHAVTWLGGSDRTYGAIG